MENNEAPLTITLGPVEYVFTGLDISEGEAIASIKEFIADSKEFDAANFAAIALAEAQLAALDA